VTCIVAMNELSSCSITLMKDSWAINCKMCLSSCWAVDGSGECRASYKVKQLNHVSGGLDCGCAWSLTMRLILLAYFYTTQLPFMNSACTWGC